MLGYVPFVWAWCTLLYHADQDEAREAKLYTALNADPNT